MDVDDDYHEKKRIEIVDGLMFIFKATWIPCTTKSWAIFNCVDFLEPFDNYQYEQEHLHLCLSLHPSLHLPLYLSVYMFLYPSLCLCLHPSVSVHVFGPGTSALILQRCATTGRTLHSQSSGGCVSGST